MRYIRFFLVLLTNFVGFAQAGGNEIIERDRVLAIQEIELIDRPALLIGMGLTQQLNDDYYIGAFYLDGAVDYAGDKAYFEMDVPRRMVFKFASEYRISSASFVRNLREAIRINNESKKTRPYGKKLGELLRLLNGSYRKGDMLVFDYHRNFGVRVRLNGRVLGQVKGPSEFYGILVNVWVGNRPPSTKFKAGIMGRNTSEDAINLLKRYVAL